MHEWPSAFAAADYNQNRDPEAKKYGMKRIWNNRFSARGWGKAAAVFTMAMVLAVGDGNHSLAAAKRFWEEKRETLPENERETDPARFALVEIENIHEPSLDFEPIHRVIFDTDTSAFAAEFTAHRTEWEAEDKTLGERVAAAESFCRAYIAAHGGYIDYIHRCGHYAFRIDQFRQTGKAFVGHVYHSDIRFYRAKWKIGRLCLGVRQAVEKSRFPDIRQSYYSAFHDFLSFF